MQSLSSPLSSPPFSPLAAYCGAPPAPTELLARWNLDPWLLAILVITGVGWRLFIGPHRNAVQQRAFAAAWAVLFVAFVSPLCAATVALFSARAVHHVLLVAVAAPLLALASADRQVRPASPLGVPLLCATGVLYLWHLPPLYDAALESTAVYWLMQTTLLASATWFWAGALSMRTPPATALLAMVASAALMGLLGALLTFAPQPLYLAHLSTTAVFGLTPLEDQQLAGLVMWVPALLPYLVLAGIAARRWSRAWARAEA
jgi:putative membrane protein